MPAATDFHFSTQLKATFHPGQKAIWARWLPSPRPCFNTELLDALRRYIDFIERSKGRLATGLGEFPIEYIVLSSAYPGVFNTGGDLDLFMKLIRLQDRAALLTYGEACIHVLYRNYLAFDLPLTTIALVQGECLAGGFEAALSSDVVIAENHSTFGFPEILFNLFPGMGAYSFLARRIGHNLAQQLLSSGKRYSAQEMFDQGVIDLVVDAGQGEAAVNDWIGSKERSRNGLLGIAKARRVMQKLDYAELLAIVDIWVDRALAITPRDLKLMQRLVGKQNSLEAAIAKAERGFPGGGVDHIARDVYLKAPEPAAAYRKSLPR
jgi:DSF synthase